MTRYPLDDAVYSDAPREEPIRIGFGAGLKAAGEHDSRIVALCADLTESTQMSLFRDAFPARFIEVGVAEQNLVTVASGMARAGKIPFASSYAAFSPGRNWEQFKTTAALNDMPVKLVGSHAGINVGPDGATHQMLEDIALMRALPNVVVVAPGDSIEAKKATEALAQDPRPAYLRLARDKTPVFSTEASPFEIGRGYMLRGGSDVLFLSTGTMTYHMLIAAETLENEHSISVAVMHVPTIKPLDAEAILAAVENKRLVVAAEEAQTAGGFGGAVAELLSEFSPHPLLRIGIDDRYGESGDPKTLMREFGLTAGPIVARVLSRFDDNTPASAVRGDLRSQRAQTQEGTEE